MTQPTNKSIEDVVEEFKQKVKELNTVQDWTNREEGEVYEFGYKTLKGDEIFTITDFGNIEKWLTKSLTSLVQTSKEELIKEIEALDTTCDYDEHCVCAGKKEILEFLNQ